MKVDVQIDGMNAAIDRINKVVGEVEHKGQAALWEAGLKVLRSAQKRLKDSVVTGNLRASGYVRNAMSHQRPEPSKLENSKNEPIPGDQLPVLGVEVGFTANYALWAHEILTGRAPKYLERAITENEAKIIEIIRKRTGADG